MSFSYFCSFLLWSFYSFLYPVLIFYSFLIPVPLLSLSYSYLLSYCSCPSILVVVLVLLLFFSSYCRFSNSYCCCFYCNSFFLYSFLISENIKRVEIVKESDSNKKKERSTLHLERIKETVRKLVVIEVSSIN